MAPSGVKKATQAELCCSSPAAILYWFAISLIAWGALSVVGIYWNPLHASSAPTIIFAMAVGCIANWVRNRTFHCAVTGPIFLTTGTVFLLSSIRVIDVKPLWVWVFVAVGVGTAFWLECRYGKRACP
jgi:hypothetical protein